MTFHFPKNTAALAAALLLGVAPAAAQSFQSAKDEAGQDLQAALEELGDVRETIASEKVPLVREVTKMEETVRQKTAELERLRRLRDNRDLGLNRLREQVKAMEEQNDYTAGLLDEFVRSFESRIHFSETQLYGDVAEEARLALDDSDLSQARRFDKQLDVVSAAIDRMTRLTGGYTFEGEALMPSGEIETGTFGVFGPSVYFASGASPVAGITYNKLNAAEPAVAPPGEGYAEGIRAFLNQGEGRIPADATLGKALKIAESEDSVLQHLAKGGPVGVVIIVLGGICLLIGLFKVGEITRFTPPRETDLRKVLTHLENGQRDDAQAAAAGAPGAGGDMLRTGLENAGEKRGTLEEILYERILAVRPKLERFLPFMALTAAAAPLLGLLGTVTGMIKTFNLITIFGTGDAKSLSSGISEALVTTELGLIVAIPSLILHGLLARMAKQKIGDMEQSAVGFINGVIGARNTDGDQ